MASVAKVVQRSPSVAISTQEAAVYRFQGAFVGGGPRAGLKGQAFGAVEKTAGILLSPFHRRRLRRVAAAQDLVEAQMWLSWALRHETPIKVPLQLVKKTVAEHAREEEEGQ
eukprot:1628278-Pyramimonas_sp.AAC.1